jgi:small-conductance mechanosensitive channel
MWDRFKERGVQTPFPKRDLHTEDGNMVVTLNLRSGSVSI